MSRVIVCLREAERSCAFQVDFVKKRNKKHTC